MDQIANVGAPVSEDPKLIIYIITFELTREVARNLLKGTKEGVWGTEVQRGPGAEPRW